MDDAGRRPAAVPVWDAAVRVLHWTLVAGVAVAWFTADSRLLAHQAAGYVALAAVALRVAWGFAGGRYARFRQFVRGPLHTARYALAVLARGERRHVGHNPLGGWMALALLACTAAVAITGWACTTDRWWGDPDAAALHEGLAWTLLALAAVHVAGALHASVRHRENLVAAMVGGSKRAPGPHDID